MRRASLSRRFQKFAYSGRLPVAGWDRPPGLSKTGQEAGSTFSRAARVLCALTASVALAQQTATVEGTVTNALTGEPLLRAHVTLRTFDRDGGGRKFGALTDAQGKFSITGLPPGSYMASTERVGFVPDRETNRMPEQFQLRAGEKKDDLKLKLTPTGAITGRVLDSEGEPAEFIGVAAEGSGFQFGQYVLTDEKGQFRIGGLGPGRYRIRATPHDMQSPPEIRTDGTVEVHHATTWYPNSLAGEAAGRVQVQAGGETSGIEIKLVRVSIVRVSGRVRGVPEGAQNTMVEIGQDGGTHRSAPIKPDGSFEIWRLDPGTYHVSAVWRRPGEEELRTAAVEVEVRAANVDNLELAMMPPSDMAGRVIFEDEQPKPAEGRDASPRMLWLNELGGRTSARPAQVGVDGSFRLEKVPPGRFRVMLSGISGYVKSVLLGAAEMDRGILDLRNGAGGAELTVVVSSATGQVEGTVRDGTEPASGALVALATDDPEGGDRPRLNMTREGGRYSFDGIPPGRYRLAVIDETDIGSVMRGRRLADYGDAVETVEVLAKEKTTKDLKRRAPGTP